ncbi:hypothetical protein ER308_19330 [Egibacter rhizosphaerae]|uniref:Uncharacterized protein n=1 Tax=Egibacter rhizosphaerae TaxID=1670831 RepID=A0A411YJX6_9ACTN|nr:hypothetical protein [Egibacter rhizosphaerae]QBI21509.1 hypothetical protein ER308_19330 [Egibacter rhizosphaerae]
MRPFPTFDRPTAALADDRGAALVAVLGWTAILASLVAALMAFALNGSRQSAEDQDWHAALGAAEAGVDDFVHRVNRDSTFWQDAVDCEDPDEAEGQPRCEFVDTPGAGSVGEYRYTVNTGEFEDTGGVTVVATGRVRDRTRTIEATIRRTTFLDFVYFTDYDMLPGRLNDDCDGSDLETYYWQDGWDGTTRDSDCNTIRFVSDDVIDGPFHTNDVPLVEGSPTWNAQATSSNPQLDPTRDELDDPDPNDGWADFCPYTNRCSPGTPDPDFQDGDPTYRPSQDMPPTNDAVRAAADPEDATAGEGCLYLGPTHVELLDGGQMSVLSPLTPDSHNPGQGCPGHGNTGSHPDNGVIYVATGSEADGSHPLEGSVIPSGDATLDSNPVESHLETYDPEAGDLFIEGTVDGHLTAASANDVIISWHLEYANGTDSDEDLIGLIAQNDVKVMGAVAGSRTGGPSFSTLDLPRHGTTFDDPRIHAGLLALNGVVKVQNYAHVGDRGTLNITGAIAQRYRGPVGLTIGSGRSGYAKNYTYDWRLQRLSPPHFIEPVDAQYDVAEWAERVTPDVHRD